MASNVCKARPWIGECGQKYLKYGTLEPAENLRRIKLNRGKIYTAYNGNKQLNSKTSASVALLIYLGGITFSELPAACRSVLILLQGSSLRPG